MTLLPTQKAYRRSNKPSKSQRRRILKRDNYTCQLCGKTPPEIKLTTDHIKPADPITGYDNRDSNIRTLCFQCNLKTRRQRRDAIQPGLPVNAIPKFCKHGHRLTLDNLYLNIKGYRDCRICRNERARQQYLINKHVHGNVREGVKGMTAINTIRRTPKTCYYCGAEIKGMPRVAHIHIGGKGDVEYPICADTEACIARVDINIIRYKKASATN